MDSRMNDAVQSFTPDHAAMQWSNILVTPERLPLGLFPQPLTGVGGESWEATKPRHTSKLPAGNYPSFQPTSWLSLSPSSRLPFMVATFRRFCTASWDLP